MIKIILLFILMPLSNAFAEYVVHIPGKRIPLADISLPQTVNHTMAQVYCRYWFSHSRECGQLVKINVFIEGDELVLEDIDYALIGKKYGDFMRFEIAVQNQDGQYEIRSFRLPEYMSLPDNER